MRQSKPSHPPGHPRLGRQLTGMDALIARVGMFGATVSRANRQRVPERDTGDPADSAMRVTGFASGPGDRLMGVWSLWSENSVLSICSQDSVLSIGSAASFASVASVGSFASAGSIGSAMSAASLLAYQSSGSALSYQSRGSVLSSRCDRAFRTHRSAKRVPAGTVSGCVLAALVAIAIHRARR